MILNISDYTEYIGENRSKNTYSGRPGTYEDGCPSPDRNGILFLRRQAEKAEKDTVDSGKQLLKNDILNLNYRY